MKQLTRETILALPFQAYIKTGLTVALPVLIDGPIQTLEGVKQARAGDYLCIGVKGEIRPVRKAHFEAEKVRIYDINHCLSVYKSTGTRYAVHIDEEFAVLKDTGEVKFTSAPDGGYLVWNGQVADFKAWIVETSIFEASYELVEVEYAE